MKRNNLLLGVLALIFATTAVKSQQSTSATAENPTKLAAASDYKANVYGFARADYIFDSRQNAQAREEALDLYPLDKSLDANGKDKNGAGSSNFLAFVSRIGVKASGPNVWGAKTSAVIEADFFGNTNANTGVLYMRHAYAQLDWAKTTLLFGQTWYPAFILDCYPGVINFNTGILFNPFGRAPQIKLTQRFTPNISVDIAAYKMSSHSAPSVTANANDASTNAMMPTFHAKIQYKDENITTGIAAEYQSLKPQLVSNNKVSDNTVDSEVFLAYFKYSNAKFTGKAYAATGGNMYQFVMLGGMAGYTDSNGQESYKPTKTTAFWVDLASNNAKIAPGVFFGYTKNNGVESGFKTLYTRGITAARALDDVWRASARVEFKQNKFRIAPELEYTSATYGDTTSEAKAGTNKTTVGNFRGLVSAQYSF